MTLAVLGIGSVTALGAGRDTLRAGLRGDLEPRIETETIETAAGAVTLPVYRAGCEGVERFVPVRRLRRLDRLSRMALLATSLALEDAGFEIEDRSRVGLAFGTGYGPEATSSLFKDSLIDAGDRWPSPTAFAGSVHNAQAAQVSITLGIEGPCQTVTTFGQTVAGVLSWAEHWLVSGTVDRVIAGFGDEYLPLLGYAITALAGGAPAELRPFRFDACTLVPGEGYVALVLGPAGHEPRYCVIEPPAAGRLTAEHAAPLSTAEGLDAVFLAACGDRRPGAAYRRVALSGVHCAAHAPLYGSLPAGLGFELACAALSIADGVIHETPRPDGCSGSAIVDRAQPLSAAGRIACLALDGDGFYTRVDLHR